MVCFEIPIHKVKISFFSVEGEKMMNAHLDEETQHYMNEKARDALFRALAEWSLYRKTGESTDLMAALNDIVEYAGNDHVDHLVWEVASEVWNNGPFSVEYCAKSALSDLKRIFDDVTHGSIPIR